MRHPGRTAQLLAALALLASLAAAPVARAQEATAAATASPFCALLTTAEVTAAIALDVTIGQSLDDYCSYDASNGYTSLTVQHDADGTKVADLKPYFSDATDTTVAGHPGLLVLRGSALYVEVPDGTLSVQLLGYPGSESDATAALLGIAPTALDRLALLEGGPDMTPGAAQSFAGDADLAALFPTTIGGESLQVQTYTATALAGQGVDPATIQAISDGLAGVGRTLDDMTLGFSSYSGGDLSAIRVRDVEAAGIEQQLMPLALDGVADPRQTTMQVAGKDVIKVTDGADESDALYFYAHDDVLWIVMASDPDLTEIMQALP